MRIIPSTRTATVGDTALCPFNTPSCVGRYHHTADTTPAAGELCESEFAVFETRDPERRLAVSAGRWHDDQTSHALVWLGEHQQDAAELTPESARRLATALLEHAELAERALIGVSR